jgi:hypothetical protein
MLVGFDSADTRWRRAVDLQLARARRDGAQAPAGRIEFRTGVYPDRIIVDGNDLGATASTSLRARSRSPCAVESVSRAPCVTRCTDASTLHLPMSKTVWSATARGRLGSAPSFWIRRPFPDTPRQAPSKRRPRQPMDRRWLRPPCLVVMMPLVAPSGALSSAQRPNAVMRNPAAMAARPTIATASPRRAPCGSSPRSAATSRR